MAWLFESFTGKFINDLSLSEVPIKFHGLYSLRDYLQRTFQTRLGNVPSNALYGLPMSIDRDAKVPDNIKEKETIIKNIILQNEPNTRNVRIGHWTLNKKGYLQCIIIVNFKSRERFKFRFNLIGNGAHTVDIWSSSFR